MGYLNESGLARYDGLLKNWVTFKSGTVDGIDPLLNWQKTETAGAVTFYPLPAAPLDPVVNFTFTETGPAEGTKSPDNPSTITGVTQVKVTRCGKNLLQINNLIQSPNVGLSITVNEDGTISVSGSTPSSSGSYLYFFNPTQNINFGLPNFLALGKTYTSSFSCNDANIQFTIYFHNGTSWSSVYSGNQTFTVPTNAISCMIRLLFPSGTTFNATAKIQIEEGSTATSFEPYEGTDYTIDLGGTYYGGSLDLSAGVMTVTYHAFELTPSNLNIRTPTETASGVWNVPCIQLLNENYVNVFGYNTSAGYNGSNYFCNMLDWNASGSTVSYHFSSSNFYMTIEADSASAATSYISSLVAEKYAAGTPVFAGYPLATPYTVQLTPTQIYSLSQPDLYTPRLNTVYSDQTSVQVGYPKSPQATSTELTNAIISLGGNI